LLWTVETIYNNNNNNNVDDITDAASASASASASTTKIEGWCLLTDQIQINSKIEYITRDFIRNISALTKKHEQQKVLESQTTIFIPNNKIFNYVNHPPQNNNKNIHHQSSSSSSS
jgi:hypothetical protein